MSRFSDRLDHKRYEDDPVFGVCLGDETPSDEDAVWVPERIMERIVALGRAYELHLVATVENQTRTHFNGQQAHALAEELAFVIDRVNDHLVHTHGRRLVELVARGARQATGVTFEGQ